MTAHDPSAFLQIDTPANACTTTDRALREAFRASMDAPQEKAGVLDQLNARIAALKPAPKAAKATPPTQVADTQATATPQETPKDPEGSLFAHLNEMMPEKQTPPPEDAIEATEKPASKSIVVRLIMGLIPAKKAKAGPKPTIETASAAPVQVIEKAAAAPSKSIILRALSGLKPKPKAQQAAPAKEASGSVVIAILKAISPIKKSA